MRKSSMGGRPSISGAPLRIRHENTDAFGNRQSMPSASNSKNRMRSSGSQGRSSLSRPWDSKFSTGPKTGRRRLTEDNIKGLVFLYYKPKKRATSSLATGRASGIGVRGRTDIPKDPRPISDRGYQHQCTRKILDFLIRNNYPHAISEKLLAAPPSKDFFKIFEFIHGMISADYKMGTKMEEEVPRILKMLGYPFTVSKTYLYSVGSPHVWPNLSAALTWMIDLVEMADGVTELGGVDNFIFQPPIDDLAEVIPEVGNGKILFNYCEHTYKAFMSGLDTFEEEDDELKATLQQKYQGRNIEELAEENAKLEEELQILGQTEERLQWAQNNVIVGRQNVKKCQNYNSEMDIYKSNLALKLKGVEEDCSMIDTDLQMQQKELVKLKEKFDNQQLMPTDVERMKEESETLKRQIKELEVQEEALDSQCFKINIDMAKTSEKVASEVAAYNAGASDLKLIPETTEHAKGQDYSLSHSCTSNMNSDIEHTILPRLLQLKKQVKEEIRRTNKQVFQGKFGNEQLQESVNDLEEEINAKMDAFSKVETEIGKEKEFSQKENKSRIKEKSRMEDRISVLKKLIKEAEADKIQEEHDHQSLLQEQEAKRKDHERDIQILSETSDKIKDSLSQSKENFNMDFEQMVQFLEEEHAKADERLRDVGKEQEERRRWLEGKRQQIANFVKKD